MAERFPVLVLADDGGFDDVVAGALPRERFDVQRTADRSAALDPIEAGTVDCVLVDSALVCGEGSDALERMSDADSALPVVVALREGAGATPATLLARGATDYVRLGDGAATETVLATRVENAARRYRSTAAAGRPASTGETNGDVTFDHYVQILEDLGQGTFVTDAEGVHVDVNTDAGIIAGYDDEELVGSRTDVLWDEETYEEIRETILALWRDEDRELTTVEADMQSKEGGTVPVELTMTVRYDEDGQFAGTIGVARDITERREAERRFREYEAILRSFPDEIAVLDTDGVMTSVIPPTGSDLTTTGYDPVDLAGQHVGMMMPDDALEEAIDLIVDMVETDREHGTVEFQLIGKDGQSLWREAHIALLNDADGSTVGSVVTLRDIAERKSRERELERFETLIDLMPDAVVLTDLEGTVTEMHGYDGWRGPAYEDIVDEHMATAITDESARRAETVVSDLLASEDREQATFEVEVVTSDGDRVPYDNHVTVLPSEEDGAIPGTMSVLRDISDRKAYEHELERQNERLEQFASIASHDLRNPLNLAQGYLEMVAAECDSEHVETVDHALERMEQLIEDTLTWARQGVTVDDPTPIDLADVAPACWEAVDAEGATLATVDDVTVRGDPDRVRRLLENLFRNAVEHGGEDVTIEVGTIRGSSDADAVAGFYVEDDGPGIPEEERDDVFQAGFTTATDGTGYGLAIIAEICVAHGWEIDVTESEAGGARFEVTGVDGQD